MQGERQRVAVGDGRLLAGEHALGGGTGRDPEEPGRGPHGEGEGQQDVDDRDGTDGAVPPLLTDRS